LAGFFTERKGAIKKGWCEPGHDGPTPGSGVSHIVGAGGFQKSGRVLNREEVGCET